MKKDQKVSIIYNHEGQVCNIINVKSDKLPATCLQMYYNVAGPKDQKSTS